MKTVLFPLTFVLIMVTILINPVKSHAFTDVPDNAYYAEAVKNLASRGIINGGSDGLFKPENPITRGQVAIIVARSLNLQSTESTASFLDVSKSHEFYPYIQALAQRKIINGYPDGTFGVNDKLTRAQAAKILTLAYELPLANTVATPFKDIETSTLSNYIETLYAYGITSGISASEFGPNANITRGSLAVMVRKLEQLSTPTSIDYADLGAEKVSVHYEYPSTSSLFVTSNDTENKRLILTPLLEGQSTILFEITKANGESTILKHVVNVTKTNNKLSLTIAPTTELEAAQFIFSKNEFSFTPTKASVTKTDGTPTKTVDILLDDKQFVLNFYAKGSYIITFSNDQNEKIRVAVEIIEQNTILTGKAVIEKQDIILTKELLGYNPQNATIQVIEDNSHSVPITAQIYNGQIILKVLSEGTCYLQVQVKEKIYYYIVETTKLQGMYQIEIYNGTDY